MKSHPIALLSSLAPLPTTQIKCDLQPFDCKLLRRNLKENFLIKGHIKTPQRLDGHYVGW